MSSQRCSNCSAPIPLSGSGDVVRCPFCKTENRVSKHADVRFPAHLAANAPRAAASNGAKGGIIVVIGLSAFLMVVGVMISLLTLSPGPAPQQSVIGPAPVAVSASAVATPPLLRVSDLGSWQGTSMHTALDPSGMIGEPARFDPIANVPWVVDIARHWTPDAVLYAVYVTGVTREGTIDTTAASSGTDAADYRFFSPTRRTAARQLQQVATELPVTELRVMVGANGVHISADTETDPDESSADPLPDCPLASVLGTLMTSGLPVRPGYDLMARARDGEWRWSVNMTGLPSSPGHVAARCPTDPAVPAPEAK